MRLRKRVNFVGIRIQYRNDFSTIHHFCFRHKTVCDATTSYDSNLVCILAFCTKHGRRYAFCTRKINNLAILVQIIKFSLPITTNCKYINIVFLNIVNLLSKVILNDYLVSIASSLNRLNTFKHIIANIQLAAPFIKAIACNANN